VTGLAERLAAQIAQTGPMSVAQFMAAALHDPQHGYYSRGGAIGGDFITAPEVSQMFGELIGLWCAHEWEALGRPDPVAIIELGPGTGALISDAWRAWRATGDLRAAAQLHLVEISPGLRAAQAEALARAGARASWHAALGDTPRLPALIIANEFLDCMPIRQFVRSKTGWREKQVGVDADGALRFGLGPPLPPPADDAEIGSIREVAPGLPALIDQLAQRLHAAPCRALIIDYGGDGAGDTLQAVRRHAKIDPLAAPGEGDLTAHVDFVTLARLARDAGLDVAGPRPQGEFLCALGLEARAAALARAHPERAERIGRELQRLSHPDAMGVLFKALCLSSPSLPPPAGF
jgi:SAM-dependent MidA family methyltransferase